MPRGGAHREREQAIAAAADAVADALDALCELDGPTLRNRRREKFLAMGKNGIG